MKNPRNVRDQQICLYFSAKEKEAFDKLCDLFIMSRADFVRAAMYIAVNDPEVYMNAVNLARIDGILTGALHHRRKK